MTCIVGIEHGDGAVTLGADGCSTGGGTQRLRATPKVFVAHGIGYACAGSIRVHNIIEHDFTPPKHPKGMANESYLVCHFIEALRTRLTDLGALRKDNEVHAIPGTSLLIAYRGELYLVASDFQIHRTSTGHDAAGSGEDQALGSLATTDAIGGYSPRRRAEYALGAAAAHNWAVRPPFTILEVRA